MTQKTFIWECETFHKSPSANKFSLMRRSMVFALDDISAWIQARELNKQCLPLVGESYIKVRNV